VTAADVLRKAADMIEPEGCWIQGAWGLDREGKVTMSANAVRWCADWAIAVAARDGYSPARQALKAAVGSIPIWNDAPNQTQTNVVATMRSVADKLERETP